MDIIRTTRAKQKQFDQMFIWYKTINEQIWSMMKSGTTQEKLLVVMDNYIDCLKKNSNTFVRFSNKCYLLAKAISCALFMFKDLNRTSTETHEYLLKICELLSFYTFLELKYSSKFNSSKVTIAERISSNYDIHLKDVNIFYTLRVFLCIPTLFNEKEIMSKIFQKYLNRHQQITQTAGLPDNLYCMYLVAYSQWISLESDEYERIKICESANKNIKPMDTLCANKIYAPFLPVYSPNDSDVTKNILSNRINVKLLTKVLQNEASRKETILIDLCESDSSTILQDTCWTNKSPSDEKCTTVKLESPSIVETIDLTEEAPTSWELSWLNELLRKSRTSMPANIFSVFPPKFVDSFEVITIQDDADDDRIIVNSEPAEKLSVDNKECDESIKPVERIAVADASNSNLETDCVEENKLLIENNIKKDNFLCNDILSKSKEEYCIQYMAANNKAQSDVAIKKTPDSTILLETNNISNSSKTNIKTYEKNKDYTELNLLSPSTSSADADILSDKKLDVRENQTNSSTTFNKYNNLCRAKSPRPTYLENCKSSSGKEEDIDDINSPPVECFSKSDTDELVQLIDRNTKESKATKLFHNRPKDLSSKLRIPTSDTVAASSSCIRKVKFKDPPEIYITPSTYYPPQNFKNMEQKRFIKQNNQSTKLSANNTTVPTSDLNFNQPKDLCRTSKSSTVQELVSSADRTHLPVADRNRQNNISGTIGSLFMMKFPQPTFQKLENFNISSKNNNNIISNANCDQRTSYDKSKNCTQLKKNDKKHMSDFDRYLEKLKEKRSKTIHLLNDRITKNPVQSQFNTSVQKEKTVPRQIKTSVQKENQKKTINKNNVKKIGDKKLKQKLYVKIERLDLSQYITSKLDNSRTLKEERSNKIIKSANPYIRIKRIRNIKENIIQDIENNDKVEQNVLSYAVEPATTSKLITLSKNISEINSIQGKSDNSIRHNLTTAESSSIKKIHKINSVLPLNEAKNSIPQEEKHEKIVTSQSETLEVCRNNLNTVNYMDENELILKQCQLRDLENEVTSTQDHVDLLNECIISSTNDISNKEVCNSVQNNEIDTSNQLLVRHRRKRKSPVDSQKSSLSKKKLFHDIQDPNFSTDNSDKKISNNEANLPTTTTTLNTSIMKRGRRKKQTQFRKNCKTSTTKHNKHSNENDVMYTTNNESPNIYTVFGDYKSDNLRIAKTYSMHNLVSQVFVPPEVENNF